MSRPILIAGPTASGKSALAMALAAQYRGVIVNADSMQVYDCWRVLSARPSPDEEAQAPHRLYGHIAPETVYSVGSWLRDLYPILKECEATDQTAIIVGGTGLYFKSLTEGLSMIPPIPDAYREEAEARLAELGRKEFHAALLDRDPKAVFVDPLNPRRLLRAWEVFTATGKSLADWAAETPPPLLPLGQTQAAFVLEADPDWLRARIESRFDAMLAEGALDEVRAVAALGLDDQAPALKAHGAPALTEHLASDLTLEEATEIGKADTRRYAKRQRTWFRNQMAGWPRIPAGEGALPAAIRLIEGVDRIQ